MADRESLKYHRKDVEIPKDLVPIRQVLADMADPNAGVAASAARTYYYEHYATDAERKRMDDEDRRLNYSIRVGFIMFGLFVVAIIISQFIK